MSRAAMGERPEGERPSTGCPPPVDAVVSFGRADGEAIGVVIDEILSWSVRPKAAGVWETVVHMRDGACVYVPGHHAAAIAAAVNAWRRFAVVRRGSFA